MKEGEQMCVLIHIPALNGLTFSQGGVLADTMRTLCDARQGRVPPLFCLVVSTVRGGLRLRPEGCSYLFYSIVFYRMGFYHGGVITVFNHRAGQDKTKSRLLKRVQSQGYCS